MSLDLFQVSAVTDGKTVCKILVEPGLRRCSITITVDRRIVRQGDESDILCKSMAPSDWFKISDWESRASNLARQFSPFWRGETAS